MLLELKRRLTRLIGWPRNQETAFDQVEIERAMSSRKDIDPMVARAVLQVPRGQFVAIEDRSRALEDRALSIGKGQTISQPSLVAHMISRLELQPGQSRVLDVGCGSGYQAAILALLAREVISVERIVQLADTARERLSRLGYVNVTVVQARNDLLGHPEGGPYDAIIVGAGVPAVPPSLIDQLLIGGRMVIPVGQVRRQRLAMITRRSSGIDTQYGLDCVFVPLIGPEAW